MADRGAVFGGLSEASALTTISTTDSFASGGIKPSADFVLNAANPNDAVYPMTAMPTIQFRSGSGFKGYLETSTVVYSGQLWPRGDK